MESRLVNDEHKKRTKSLRFEVIINEVTYKVDLASELFIDADNINTELSYQSGKYSWFATMAEALKALKSKKERKLEEAYAELYNNLRKNWTYVDSKKPTETSLKNAVLTHKDYKKACEELEDVIKKLGLMSAAKEAFMMRKDCLIQLSANQRQEKSIY